MPKSKVSLYELYELIALNSSYVVLPNIPATTPFGVRNTKYQIKEGWQLHCSPSELAEQIMAYLQQKQLVPATTIDAIAQVELT